MKYEFDPTCQLPSAADLFEKHIGYKTDGAFVEVGAFDGKTYGCTWGLSQAGWRGLYVEPIPEFLEECRRNHAFNPRIEFEQSCASNHEGAGVLYLCGEYSSTLLNDSSRAWGAGAHGEIPVQFKKLDRILQERNWPKDFDLLVIDVEEAELEVLGGLDLGRWRPRMMVIELHELHEEPAKRWKAAPVTQLLAAKGYSKVFADDINTVFVASERPGP